MDKFFNNLFGFSLTAPALTLNVKGWLFGEHINFILTIIISLLAIAWWSMKIYDQYVITRRRKDEIDILEHNNHEVFTQNEKKHGRILRRFKRK